MNLLEILITSLSYFRHPYKRRFIKYSSRFKGKTGLEIGGPSSFFGLKGIFPIYLYAKSIDGVNFSTETIWEGLIEEGKTYKYYKSKEGNQFIDEASKFTTLEKSNYQFVLSCHSLEHVANPIKALKNWASHLHIGGDLVLILPDKENTFDNKRPYTTFDHLLADEKNNIQEDDSTHFEEIIASHSMKDDTALFNKDDLKQRLSNNLQNRCAHHHVFSLDLIKELLNYCGFDVSYQQKAPPFHLVTLARKR